MSQDNSITFPTVAELLSKTPPDLLPPKADRAGWNSDHPVFDRLVELTQPETIIEVGTWKGRSAAHLAAAAPTARIFCVDTWIGGVDHVLSRQPQDDLLRDPAGSPRMYHQFLRNFADGEWEQLASQIVPLQQTSLNGARLLAVAGVQARLVYIDGSHEYDDVYADLLAYRSLLAEGGILFGDDFRAFPGVFAAVLRFRHESQMKFEEVDGNFWILS